MVWFIVWLAVYIIGFNITGRIATNHRPPHSDGEGELTAAFLWPLALPLILTRMAVEEVVKRSNAATEKAVTERLANVSKRAAEISRAWNSTPVNLKRPA